MIELYSYWRSSAAYRVRIALNWKRLEYRMYPVHLTKGGGEQFSPWFQAMNPSHAVPILRHQDSTLHQSLAIIEYLDERFPSPPLLPKSAPDRAIVRALALDIAADTHPLNNLRVLNYLQKTLGHNEATKTAWYRHWVATSLQSLETRLAQSEGKYCHGDAVTMADACLVPQIYNAQRFDCDLSPYPKIVAIYQHLLTFEAFQAAKPERQPDAE